MQIWRQKRNAKSPSYVNNISPFIVEIRKIPCRVRIDSMLIADVRIFLSFHPMFVIHDGEASDYSVYKLDYYIITARTRIAHMIVPRVLTLAIREYYYDVPGSYFSVQQTSTTMPCVTTVVEC